MPRELYESKLVSKSTPNVIARPANPDREADVKDVSCLPKSQAK